MWMSSQQSFIQLDEFRKVELIEHKHTELIQICMIRINDVTKWTGLAFTIIQFNTKHNHFRRYVIHH